MMLGCIMRMHSFGRSKSKSLLYDSACVLIEACGRGLQGSGTLIMLAPNIDTSPKLSSYFHLSTYARADKKVICGLQKTLKHMRRVMLKHTNDLSAHMRKTLCMCMCMCMCMTEFECAVCLSVCLSVYG